MTDAVALLELAQEAARGAGQLLLEYFGRPARGVESKTTPTDLVSEADRASERLLIDLITRRRPDDGIVSEEGAARAAHSEFTWVLDPLDGTVNFLFGIRAWCVSIAVEDGSGPVVGVVHDPCAGETFSACRGAGARLNGAPIHVTDRDLSEALVGTGFSYDADARREQAAVVTRVLPRVRDIRRAGSAALDLASVAAGRLDGFYEAPMEVWDRAAGVLLVQEAGGVVTDLPAPRDLSTGVVAAGPRLHERLRALVISSG